MVKILIEKGANVNQINYGYGEDWSPLHVAVYMKHKDVIELLIANHADLNYREKVCIPLLVEKDMHLLHIVQSNAPGSCKASKCFGRNYSIIERISSMTLPTKLVLLIWVMEIITTTQCNFESK